MSAAEDAVSRDINRAQGLRGRLRLPRRPRHLGALVAAAVVALVVAMPLIALFVIAFGPSDGAWPHLARHVLPQAVQTTLLLIAGVALSTMVVGVGTAWLVTMCRFPGRAVLDAALILPLAVPTYIVAYCYVQVFDFTGPVQSAIRALFGFATSRDYWFPEIRSLPGAIFVMSAVLYPYVYLTTRVLFLMQSGAALDVCRTLGASPWTAFWRVALPLARPAIVVGVSLAIMETLNDIGAVEFFGVRTLTFAIYETWLNRGSLVGAAQIAVILLFLVFVLLAAERAARGRQRYHVGARQSHGPACFPLAGWRAAGATLACALPVGFGFVLPLAVLLDYSSRRIGQFYDPALHAAALNSLTVAGLAALAAVAAGLVLVYAVRLSGSRLVWMLGRVSSIGYTVPGTVLAVGILIPLATLDNWIDASARGLFGIGTGLLLTGSGAAIVYACTVRFLAVAYGSLEAGLAKITDHLDMAARTLRRSPRQTLFEVHMPIMRPALAAAGLLVFVDTMKELPATVLLRPFNFDTLATFVYERASRGAFEDAAVAALVIVIAGIVPLVLLLRAGGSQPRIEGIRS